MTHSLTFNFDRYDDETPRALLAMSEILSQEDDLSASCLNMLGYILDNFYECAEMIRYLFADEMGDEGQVRELSRRFKEISYLLEGTDKESAAKNVGRRYTSPPPVEKMDA